MAMTRFTLAIGLLCGGAALSPAQTFTGPGPRASVSGFLPSAPAVPFTAPSFQPRLVSLEGILGNLARGPQVSPSALGFIRLPVPEVPAVRGRPLPPAVPAEHKARPADEKASEGFQPSSFEGRPVMAVYESRLQVFDSALAYGRALAEAQEAAQEVFGTLALQVYLTLSTPAYYVPQRQAIEAVHKIRTYLGFQIYLTLRTPAYGLSHEQSLRASQRLSTQDSFRSYLHLLVSGWDPGHALAMCADAAGN